MTNGWEVRLDPDPLLPDRRAAVHATYTPERDHDGRRVLLTLRCVERYVYSRDETSTDGQGRMTTTRVTRTASNELHRIEIELAGPTRFVGGQQQAWSAALNVPPLGPPTFEGSVLRCDWTMELKVDVPRSADPRVELPVHVAQPMALLRAAVVDTGQYGLFEEAPVNTDAWPAQVKLDPVPIDLTRPFRGSFSVETPEPVEVQEVRVELRAHASVTVPGGHSEEITVARGRLVDGTRPFGGEFAQHAFAFDPADAWLPSADFPHGTARGVLHVILARAWAPDVHYVRDVALATTSAL